MRMIDLMRLTAVTVSALSLSGCADVKAACISAGICDTPPPARITIDVICDSSLGSTCTKEAIAETLDVTLAALAERPGSTLRLWAMSGTVDGVVTLGNVTSPEVAPAARARRRDQEGFVKAAKSRLMLNTDAAFVRPPAQSPIADTIARVLMAAASDERRSVVLISDAREFQSGRYDFECGPLPSPGEFAKRLVRDRVLAADAMKGIGLAFTYVGVPAVDRRRCAATIQRARDIQSIWETVVTSTGGMVLRYTDGPIESGDLSK